MLFGHQNLNIIKKETRWKNKLEDDGNTIIEEDSDGKIGLSDIVNSSYIYMFKR